MVNAKSDTGITYRLIEIDAWVYDDGWTWNDACEICTVEIADAVFYGYDWVMKKFLRDFLCERGYKASLMYIEPYGECNFEFQNPDTQEPLLAFERVYGKGE